MAAVAILLLIEQNHSNTKVSRGSENESFRSHAYLWLCKTWMDFLFTFCFVSMKKELKRKIKCRSRFLQHPFPLSPSWYIYVCSSIYSFVSVEIFKHDIVYFYACWMYVLKVAIASNYLGRACGCYHGMPHFSHRHNCVPEVGGLFLFLCIIYKVLWDHLWETEAASSVIDF